MWVNEGTPIMSFVLYTINVECMCDASYVTWKYRQYSRYHVIFARKYKTLQNENISGARFNSSGTPVFRQVIDIYAMDCSLSIEVVLLLGRYVHTN